MSEAKKLSQTFIIIFICAIVIAAIFSPIFNVSSRSLEARANKGQEVQDR